MIYARNIQKTKDYNNLIWYVKIYFVEQQSFFYPGGVIFCWVLGASPERGAQPTTCGNKCERVAVNRDSSLVTRDPKLENSRHQTQDPRLFWFDGLEGLGYGIV